MPHTTTTTPQCLQRLGRLLPARLRVLPYPALRIICILVLANITIWIVVAIVLRFHPILASSAVLSYTLGLRHGQKHPPAIDAESHMLTRVAS